MAEAPMPPPATRLRHLLAGALSLAFVFRFQLANGLTLLAGDRYDAVIELAILEHWRNVLHGLEPWARTLYFHPVPATLGYNDGYLLFGLLQTIFRGAGADPFLGGELVNLTARAIGFAAMLAVGRRVLRLPLPWALLGAVLFTIGNSLFIRASHAQLLTIGFVPVLVLLLHATLAALAAGRRGALLGWGAALCAWQAASLMTGFYMVWYTCFLGGAVLLAWLAVAGAAVRRPWFAALRAQWLPLLALGVLALAVNLPFVVVYLPKAAETGMHPWRDVVLHAPTLLDIIHVGEANAVWGWLVRLLKSWFRPDFPVWGERMTGMPPLLVGLFAASLAWLWRGGPTGGHKMDPARLALLRALAIGTVATWALTMQVGGVTGWALVYGYVPGAKAARVIARYQIFLALPVVALVATWLAAHARRLPRFVLLPLVALLLLEQANSYAPLFLDRTTELARLRAVPDPPAGCRAFYVSAARTEQSFDETVADPYNHNSEAMLLSEVLRLPTINGISTFNPPLWPSQIPDDPEYLPAVRAYAEAYGVTGLCALDLQRFQWSGPD